MIGYTRQHLTLIHIVRVREVFMKIYCLQNGCILNGKRESVGTGS